MIKRTLSAIVIVTMRGSAGNVTADDSALLQNLVERYKTLQSKMTALEAALGAKQDAMDCLYQVGTDLYIDGCNLHVRNGPGPTELTAPNGLGNLIVG